jgi:hypothetical protein
MLLITGIGALPAGYSMVTDPSGAGVGMAGMLDGTLFARLGYFLVPGIFLILVNGLFTLLLAYALPARPQWGWAQAINPVKGQHWAWTGTVAYGCFLLLWLAVQIAMIGFGSTLQYVFLVWGVVFILLPFEPHVRAYLKER